MEDQYGMADLRQYMNGRQLFASVQPPELLPAITHQHRNLVGPGHNHYEMVMGLAQVPAHGLPPHHHQHHEFLPDSSTTAAAAAAATTSSAGFSGLEMEAAAGGGDGSGRWPRQETLTLLEIRSRLDSKFKEANQKGPLWDEVSRIMSEEHGYQRTGKKCREKFENLYKYYKKTKEGKAGRQDGKHYRFFRQLEALYGETSNVNTTSVSETHHVESHFPYNPVNNSSNNNNNHDPHNFHQLAPKLSDSLSLSNSSDFNTTSSDDSDVNENSKEKSKKRRGKRSLKAKIKDFIDGQMRKLMEKQEAWFEKMMKMIENKEKERILREEEWRNQEKIRIEREHKFWANERAWIEARDATLMDALHKLTSKESKSSITTNPSSDQETEFQGLNEHQNDNVKDEHWPESEITRLIQLRTSLESRFQQMGFSGDEVLWEEIAAKMACLGYDKSAIVCKNKWDSINGYLMKCNKKRKENSTSSCYNVQINNEQQGRSYCEARHVSNDQNVISDGSCFRYLMGDADQNLWENYELKLSKGGDN
ncbi:trihelix transcription factor PTL [Nicotiana sylvestris]|uniref:Trihelix transcription factor PTL n=1 Tax=Nicotiana sylvestris TaxID=4096 RepID=A0A1U7XRM7_NICSY|nr:PREDICTED: trihelix transcription factor PTL [Nicotiana sylvestris]